MVFQIGKCYKHTSGQEMKVIGELETIMFGKTMIAEQSDTTNFKAIGRDETNAVNWTEISEEQWKKNFS